MPAVDYNKEDQAAYDVTKLAGRPEPGKAAIEAFFTAKGHDVYAILPRWPGRRFVVKDLAGIKSVTLLGGGAAGRPQSEQRVSPADSPLTFAAVGNGISIELPDVPEPLLQQPAWVLKMSR